MPIFPASIEIQHRQWSWTLDGNGDQVTDSDGNPVGALGAPITRYIIGVQQLGDGRIDPISVEYVDRTITDLILQVVDPTVYKKLDSVSVNNSVEWLSFEVQNRPTSWATGLPWQRYSSLFGGTVHVRRVGDLPAN